MPDMRWFVRTLGSLAAVASLAFAGSARAKDFCVAPASGCDGGQQATLQAALDAALGSSGPDRVRLPEGDVQGPGSYDPANPDNTVDLVGAGRDATVVTSSSSGYILDIRKAGVVSDLTVKQTNPPVAGQFGTYLRGTAERAAFVSVDSGSATSIDGTARHVKSTGPSPLRIAGTIEDSEVTGGSLYTGTGDTIVRRVRSVGPSPIGGQNLHLVVSSSLFVSTAPDATVAGFSPPPVQNVQATVVLSNLTLIGGGGPGCVGIAASGNNVYGPPDDHAVEDMTVANAIVRNCTTTLKRDSSGGNRTANLTVFNSDLDLSPSAVSQSGAGTLTAGPGDGNVNTDPLFVGLTGHEQELRFDSPIVDRGLSQLLSSEESSSDLNGNPRVVDGDGNGTPTRDMGAFEYQRRPPVASAAAEPTTAATGQTIAFMGSATESDPGETVTGLTWQFDDGAVAAGATVDHAFSAAGPHTATLTATDSAGVTGTASVPVTVLATVPSSVRVVTVSPRTFRAAAHGGSIAARRRIPVGTTVSVDLTAPAAVALTFKRRLTGRRSGRRCVPGSKRNRRAKRCFRYKAVRGSIARAAGAPASFRFTGRLRGRRLRPGRYRLIAAAGATPPKTATFRIVR